MRSVQFSNVARRFSLLCGQPTIFFLALLGVLVWAATGPYFHYSNTWQLVINTTTTIVTFLMVFVIQNTQTRDTQAMQTKLDELIRATEGAHNALLGLERRDDEQLSRIEGKYQKLADKAKDGHAAGMKDTGTPEVE